MKPFIVAAAVAALSGCTSPAEPITCEGNPRCKADQHPSVMPEFKPLPVNPGPSRDQGGAVRPRWFNRT